jgi:WD40 repeat protein
MSAPSYPRRFLVVLLMAVSLGCLFPPALIAQRRGRTSPGLVLDTGARTATCDKLVFTPDGKELLAVGDDKVVRIWEVNDSRFINHRSRTLRWPIYREQRGGIFTLGLSPDRGVPRIVIGGWGILNGYLAVLDRKSGNIENAIDDPPTSEVTWSATFSPSGLYVVYGTDNGNLFRWDLKAKAKPSHFKESGSDVINRVRLISFVDETHFLSVAQDGFVREWDLTNLDAAPREMDGFQLPDLYRVAMSKDGRWLAACGEGPTAEVRNVQLIDVRLMRGGAPRKRYLQTLELTSPQGANHYPHALAFDLAGKRLAVGYRVVPHPRRGDMQFTRVTGGGVRVFDLASLNELKRNALDLGYRCEYIAFRPGYPNQIATAGGNNHEVRLWELNRPARPLDEIRSPGSCLWGVAMSGDHYLAWKEKRSKYPRTPNDWGTGPWRILDLKKRKILTGEAPNDFDPVEPLDRLGEWRVEPTTNGFFWRVVGPKGTNVLLDWKKNRLYNDAVNQIPRCYTFLRKTDKTPVPRLAVGHTWGVSLYELRPRDVRLVRLLVGHESEVMAVAPSKDGRLLVTASRDQTLAGWSLADWDYQRELGARFIERGRTIEVRDVAPGSPAWEVGLTPGDEIIMVVSRNRGMSTGFVYDPEGRGEISKGIFKYTHKGTDIKIGMGKRKPLSNVQLLDQLNNQIEAGREYIFIWRHTTNGKSVEKSQLTTVRQRPLWRFFPTRSRDWVIWRWRDFFYDTNSVQADRLVGWHVNAAEKEELHTKPAFYPLEYYRGVDEKGPKGQELGFHRPDKIWGPRGAVAGAFVDPQKILFADIEPPDVKVTVVKEPGLKAGNLELDIQIKPRSANPKQRLGRVTLWLDDYRPPQQPEINATAMIEGQKVPVVDYAKKRFIVPRGELRRGSNHVTVQCYNEQGGRGQFSIDVNFNDGTKIQRDLHALCVGISNYSGVRGWPQLKSLNFPSDDAAEIDRILRQHSGTPLYKNTDVAKPLLDKKATQDAIVEQLKAFKGKVKRDDWFILFLAGHGAATEKGADGYEPGSFFYLCADSNRKVPGSVLTSRELYKHLAEIPCRKMVILDTCHSGDVASNPVRDLMRDGIPWLIFSSCDPKQSSNEPKERTGDIRHGLFTECILETISSSDKAAGKRRQKLVTAGSLANAIQLKLPKLLRKFDADENVQTPVFELGSSAGEPVLCEP